jgi:hypothetical protein
MDLIVTLLVWAVLACAYFAPSIIAKEQNPKRSLGAIFALNLILGWTVIGWIVALIWALTKDREPTIIYAAPVEPPPQPPANELPV